MKKAENKEKELLAKIEKEPESAEGYEELSL